MENIQNQINEKSTCKMPNYFKRNKKFLLCLLPFFIILIVQLGVNLWINNRDLAPYFADVNNARFISVFAVAYTIVMHVFWHKTNGKFSEYEINDKELKKDKKINSVLLLIPVLIILGFSLYHFTSNLNWFDSISFSIIFHIFEMNDAMYLPVEVLTSFNALLLNIFIVYMYFKGKLTMEKNGGY